MWLRRGRKYRRHQPKEQINESEKMLTVHSLQELSRLNTQQLPAGTTAYVAKLRDTFRLSDCGDMQANGTIVAHTPTPNWYWIRECLGDYYWQTRTDWYLGAGSTPASDDNDGQTSKTPIATWGELNRRLGGKFYNDITVHMQESVDSPGVVYTTGPIIFDAQPVRQSTRPVPKVLIKGPKPAIKRSGTCHVTQDPDVNLAEPANQLLILGNTKALRSAWVTADGTLSDWVELVGDSNEGNITSMNWASDVNPVDTHKYYLATLASGVTDVHVTCGALNDRAATPVVTIANLDIQLAPNTRFTVNVVRFIHCLFNFCGYPQFGRIEYIGCRSTGTPNA